jgi:hypothetical protein
MTQAKKAGIFVTFIESHSPNLVGSGSFESSDSSMNHSSSRSCSAVGLSRGSNFIIFIFWLATINSWVVEMIVASV